jgi:hypothetical protein
MSAMGDEMEREKSNLLVVKTFSPYDDSYDILVVILRTFLDYLAISVSVNKCYSTDNDVQLLVINIILMIILENLHIVVHNHVRNNHFQRLNINDKWFGFQQ